MKNSVIRKIIVVLLSIIFLIQPAFQIFAGIGAVNAWQYTSYDIHATPKYNHETERIVSVTKFYKYSFRVYGSQNGLKIWNDDMSGLDGSWLYINNPHINNEFHVNVSKEGENHLRVRTGHLLPNKRREKVGLSYYATYTTDWTTKDTDDARTLCKGVDVVGLKGIINCTLVPQKEILKREAKITWYIYPIPKVKVETSSPNNSGNNNSGNSNNSGSSNNSGTKNYSGEFQGPINDASYYNKPTQTTTTPTGAPNASNISSTTNSGTSTNTNSGTNTNTNTNYRGDLNDNARKMYIRNLYKRVLKREPTNDEISGHFKNTSQKTAIDIILSTESNMKNNINSMTNEQFVEACYNYILGRTSDESGKKGWVNYLAKGNSRQSVINQFVASEEFKKNNNKEAQTLTFNRDTCTAVYDYLKDNGYTVIKPTETTIMMYKADVSKVTTLELNGKGLTDLSGLKVFTNLAKLSATNNKIADLSKISELTNLQQLYLTNNNLKNLNGIEKLTKLYAFNASNNQITDISKAAQLSKLITITLNNNKIADLSALANISTLNEVNVDNNNIKNAPVFGNLKKMSMKNNKISISATNGEVDLPAVLVNTTNSESIMYVADEFECTNCRIENNKIIMSAKTATVTVKDGVAKGSTVTITNKTEIIAFNDRILAEKVKNEFNLSDIKEENGKYLLFISDDAINAKKSINLSVRTGNPQKITDITGLEKLSQLTSIDLGNNNVTDFSKLSEIKTLETLKVRNNGIVNFSTLKNLKQLKQLDASGNIITDINGIENLTELQDLLLNNNHIGNNLQPISSLKELSTVSLIDNEITDVSGLANLKANNLFVDRNGIADLTPIKNGNIDKISMENNKVLVNVKGSEVDIPDVLKKAMDDNGGVSNLECTGCSINNNKLVFDNGIKLAQIKIKAGELCDTIVSVQDEDALLPPELEVEYNLSSDETRMTVIITANKSIQDVLSWNRISGQNKIAKTYYYNVSNQNILIKDLYGNETMQLIEFTGVKHPKIADLTVSYSENMITNKDVTITMSSSENLASGGYGWVLSDDKKSVSTTISQNTNQYYTTANVLTERMYSSQMQPAFIDIEVANIDKKAPECEVEYDVSNITKGAVKVIIWSDEQIEPVNAYDCTAVVKLNEDGTKKYGIVSYYTENLNTLVTVKDIANNLSTVNVNVENIDNGLDGLYSKTNVTNATKNGVKLTVGANEKIEVPQIDQATVVGKLKTKQYLTAKSAVRIANTVLLDSVGSTPVVKLAEGEEGTSFNATTSEDGKEIEVELTEQELGALLATDETNNKDLTLVNTSVIDKKDIVVKREDTLNEDGSVTVTLTTDKPVLVNESLDGWNVSEDLQTLTRTFKENVEIDLDLEDFAGNITEYNVSVNNVEGFGYEIYVEPIDGTDQVLVVIKADRQLQELGGWDISEDKTLLGKTMGINESMKLRVYDVNGFGVDVEIDTTQEPQDNGDTDENQGGNTVAVDNTQSTKTMPQTGEYMLFAIYVSVFLTALTGITLIKYRRDNM